MCGIHDRESDYLCVAGLDITEEKHHNDEEESTEKIKPTPPSTGHLDVLSQDICEWLSMLQRERITV